MMLYGLLGLAGKVGDLGWRVAEVAPGDTDSRRERMDPECKLLHSVWCIYH